MTSHHTAKDFKAGDTVHVISMDTTGTVTAPADSKGNIKVQMGILSSLLPASDLVIIETPKQNNAQVSINNKRGMGKALNIQPEINVLGMTVAEATSLVDRYLDDAMMAHLHKVRIIHGKAPEHSGKVSMTICASSHMSNPSVWVSTAKAKPALRL